MMLILSGNAFATAQAPENLLYKKERLKLHSTPLAAYFYQQGYAPEFNPVNTACRRSYVATWKIDNGVLYLVDIDATVDKKPFTVKDLFPHSEYPVKAIWYTGTLILPRGKLLTYVHSGYQSKYEEELQIQIKNGKVIKETMVKNPVPPGFDDLPENKYKILTEAEYIKTGNQLWKDDNLWDLRTLIDNGLQRFPDNPDLWDLEGAYYLKELDKKKCLAALMRALKISPTALRNLNIAWYYYKLAKEHESALIYFNKAKALASKHPQIYYYMADCYSKTGDKKSAEKYRMLYNKKMEKRSENTDIQKN
jgi:tetratricopeptide (TPR) repeat protein